MIPVTIFCDECGKGKRIPLSQFKRSKEHFCSKKCHMIHMNRELNPTRMTQEVRTKLREIHLDSGKGVSYKKLFGKHEHRVIAEQMIGRPLYKGEVVHHIDGNKRNNSKDNLQVLKSQSDHARIHFSKHGGDLK